MTFGPSQSSLLFPYQNMQIHLTDNISETNRVDRGFNRSQQNEPFCGFFFKLSYAN